MPSADPKSSLYDYAVREAELIFRHFGNHPSFVMFTLGNELGRNPAMFELVARFQKRDPRHLYAQGANNMHWQPRYAEGDDFWVTGKTGKQLPVRGAFFPGGFLGGGHINSQPPSTLVNYFDSIKDVPVPVISHETAEFEVTPDFREISKYTGVLKADARLRLEEADDVDAEPGLEVGPRVVVGDEALAPERRGPLLPTHQVRAPALLEALRPEHVVGGVRAVERGYPARQRVRDRDQVARVGLDVRVALGVDVALRAVELGRHGEHRHRARRLEAAGGAPGRTRGFEAWRCTIGSQPASSSAPVQTSRSAERILAIRLGRAWI